MGIPKDKAKLLEVELAKLVADIDAVKAGQKPVHIYLYHKDDDTVLAQVRANITRFHAARDGERPISIYEDKGFEYLDPGRDADRLLAIYKAKQTAIYRQFGAEPPFAPPKRAPSPPVTK